MAKKLHQNAQDPFISRRLKMSEKKEGEVCICYLVEKKKSLTEMLLSIAGFKKVDINRNAIIS